MENILKKIITKKKENLIHKKSKLSITEILKKKIQLIKSV